MRGPLVSVVIVNWNGLEETKECLKYLKEQTYANFETIVVDNGSHDESLKYLRNLKDIILVENPKNLGFTGGHIAGYKAAKGEYILLLNNDAIMDKNYLSNAIEMMTADQEIGALGGRAYLWDENNPLFETANKFYAYQNINPFNADGIFTQSDEGLPQEVNNVSGSCVLVRRAVIDKIGYLHGPFFAYFEESDLFARMKRAGFKIIYHPDLAIWHANAKSTGKQPPTFFFYMIMRNRFRFAVRNFDAWALRRFLWFYLKMGIASLVRSITDKPQRNMHFGYSKAFLYNLAFGIKPFIERTQLSRSLGKSDYNRIIVSEQNGVSIVAACKTKQELERFVSLAESLRPIDELVLVSDNSKLRAELKPLKAPSSVRLCINRGFFDTHPENIAVVCSKNRWIQLASTTPDIDQLNDFVLDIYDSERSGSKINAFSRSLKTLASFDDVLQADVAPDVFVKKDLLVDNGGLSKKVELADAVRELMGLGYLAGELKIMPAKRKSGSLPPYKGALSNMELNQELLVRLNSAREKDNRLSRSITKLTVRYYRLYQLYTLTVWLFSPKIPLRLKAARSKNFIYYLTTFKIKAAATELKHMHNEVIKNKNLADFPAMKQKEKDRLGYLKTHPQETTVFIILRDRFEQLKHLLDWLESQKMRRIVFIDNGSLFPPLVDFLNRTEYQVLPLDRNLTQTAPWTGGIIKVLVPDDFYIVSDPDIIPVMDSLEVISRLYEVHEKYPYFMKVGLGLKIDDLPDHYPLKKDVVKWESQFWTKQVEPGVYEAGVDTTFALYKPYSYSYMIHSSLRTGEPYTARHLPWYENGKKLSDEEIFYRMRLDHNVSSWNVDELPERYKKELEKVKK